MKKKLLFLTVKFDTGGTEKATYDIITRLDPEKYDITLMSMYGGGYYWDHLPEHIHRKFPPVHPVRDPLCDPDAGLSGLPDLYP